MKGLTKREFIKCAAMGGCGLALGLHQLDALGVNIITEKEINISDLKRMKIDVIILATGGKPIMPSIKGIDGEMVVKISP